MCCLVSFSNVEEVSKSASVVGFLWDSLELAWSGPGLPLLSNLSCPFQHFRAAILGAWRDAVSAKVCAKKGFRGPLFVFDGTLQLLNSDHVRESRFLMVIFFGIVLFHEIREHPEFHDLMELDKTSWPRCLLWHGWLPLLSGINGGGSPWALLPAEGAVNILECALGRYSSGQLTEWQLPADF